MLATMPTSLQPYNSFAVDHQAERLFLLRSADQISELLQDISDSPMPTLVLGGGTNVLFTADYPGRVIINQLLGIEVIGETADAVMLQVAAGENWHRLVLYTIEQGYFGLENLSLIPGSVGAAPVQNIGAYGVEISSVLDSVEAVHLVSGERRVFGVTDCELSYRHSVFKQDSYRDWMIVSVTLRLAKTPQFNLSYSGLEQLANEPNLTAKMVSDAVIAIRQRKLPNPDCLPNAGSFFKNPVVAAEVAQSLILKYPTCPCFAAGHDCKLSAAWLLDQAGWKGLSRNGCGVHEQHALVLINPGRVSGHQVWQLALDMQQSVYQKFGIILQPEVKIIDPK